MNKLIMFAFSCCLLLMLGCPKEPPELVKDEAPTEPAVEADAGAPTPAAADAGKPGKGPKDDKPGKGPKPDGGA